jgi:hypothetical protein
MNSTTYSEFEEWLPRPAALWLALGLWVAGLAVAGAATWRMHRVGPAPTVTSTTTVGETTVAPADGAASGAVIVIPEDVVVGRRTPPGVTLKQRP